VVAFTRRERGDITGPAAALGYIYAARYNEPVLGGCLGVERCGATCRRRCVHAEASAILRLTPDADVDLLHVKLDPEALDRARDADPAIGVGELEAMIKPSGPPSCDECSRLIAHDPRVAGIWLLHRGGDEELAGDQLALAGIQPMIARGWRRWAAEEFHRETLAQLGLASRA